MEVVVVTAWRRPEFLRATLNRLLIVDNPEVEYLISLDRRYSLPTKNVAFWFQRKIGRRVHFTVRSHIWSGNSYNVLSSYRDAIQRRPQPDLVHLIEEDVLVGKDYLDFHRAAHKLVPDVFCVSACRNQQFPPGVDPPPADSVAWLHPAYQSLGVSFRPDRLERVLRHAKPAYFGNMVGYCKQKFPNTRIPAANAEQDGLIHRVMEADDELCAYPAVPRAYHAGFCGYHRNGTKLTGTIEERAKRIEAMSTEELNRHARSYPDHQAIDLDADRQPLNEIVEWGRG